MAVAPKFQPVGCMRVLNHLALGSEGHEFRRNRDLGTYLYQVAKEKGVNQYEASRACNVSTSEVLAFWLEGLYKPTTLRKMMDLLYQDSEDVAPYL